MLLHLLKIIEALLAWWSLLFLKSSRFRLREYIVAHIPRACLSARNNSIPWHITLLETIISELCYLEKIFRVIRLPVGMYWLQNKHYSHFALDGRVSWIRHCEFILHWYLFNSRFLFNIHEKRPEIHKATKGVKPVLAAIHCIVVAEKGRRGCLLCTFVLRSIGLQQMALGVVGTRWHDWLTPRH